MRTRITNNSQAPYSSQLATYTHFCRITDDSRCNTMTKFLKAGLEAWLVGVGALQPAANSLNLAARTCYPERYGHDNVSKIKDYAGALIIADGKTIVVWLIPGAGLTFNIIINGVAVPKTLEKIPEFIYSIGDLFTFIPNKLIPYLGKQKTWQEITQHEVNFPSSFAISQIGQHSRNKYKAPFSITAFGFSLAFLGAVYALSHDVVADLGATLTYTGSAIFVWTNVIAAAASRLFGADGFINAQYIKSDLTRAWLSERSTIAKRKLRFKEDNATILRFIKDFKAYRYTLQKKDREDMLAIVDFTSSLSTAKRKQAIHEAIYFFYNKLDLAEINPRQRTLILNGSEKLKHFIYHTCHYTILAYAFIAMLLFWKLLEDGLTDLLDFKRGTLELTILIGVIIVPSLLLYLYMLGMLMQMTYDFKQAIDQNKDMIFARCTSVISMLGQKLQLEMKKDDLALGLGMLTFYGFETFGILSGGNFTDTGIQILEDEYYSFLTGYKGIITLVLAGLIGSAGLNIVAAIMLIFDHWLEPEITKQSKQLVNYLEAFVLTNMQTDKGGELLAPETIEMTKSWSSYFKSQRSNGEFIFSRPELKAISSDQSASDPAYKALTPQG